MSFTQRPSEAVNVECKTENFWDALLNFPMHLIKVPRDIEVDFLGALSFGASGTYRLIYVPYPPHARFAERILEWNDTVYPFTDAQTKRLVQIYRDLKSMIVFVNYQYYDSQLILQGTTT